MTIDRSWIATRITRRAIEAEDIVSLELVSIDGGELPAFSAGSHVDLEIAPDLIRQYSLCNNSADHGRYQLAILRDPVSRGGSITAHDRLLEGCPVRISAPRNHFPLHHTTGTSLLIAGGIGITPLLCMAERLQATGGRFALHYCARSPERTAFRDRIAASPIAAHTRFHFDSNGEGDRLDAGALFAGVGADDHVYVCGPAGFIDWLEAAATAAGIAPDRFHREYFSAGAVEAPEGGERGFAVTIASTGKVIAVAADQSIAHALEDAGIEVPVSCDQGVCGTCITRIIDGTPDHRDRLGLSGDAEFTPCCSRALSPMLVLDL
jgi:vanillate O-demethylase ferredoxin subunit